MIAKIDGEPIGAGTVTGGNYTITADPGTVQYIGKDMIFHITCLFLIFFRAFESFAHHVKQLALSFHLHCLTFKGSENEERYNFSK